MNWPPSVVGVAKAMRQRRGIGHDGIDLGAAAGEAGEAFGKGRGGGLIQAIAEPYDMQGGGGIKTGFKARQKFCAVRSQGLGFKRGDLLEHGIGIARHNIRLAGGRSGCCQREGHIAFARFIHDFIQHGAAQGPVLRRRPGIINDDEEGRAVSCRRLPRRVEGMGHAENDEGRYRQAQQHQPPGRLVGLLMLAHQFEEQAQRRKFYGLRLGRGEAQQPPDDGQQQKPRERRGRGESERLQEGHHAMPPRSKARLFAPPTRPCSIIRSLAGD